MKKKCPVYQPIRVGNQARERNYGWGINTARVPIIAEEALEDYEFDTSPRHSPPSLPPPIHSAAMYLASKVATGSHPKNVCGGERSGGEGHFSRWTERLEGTLENQEGIDALAILG